MYIRTQTPCSVFAVGNLTAQTSYEISAWAKTELGDSPLAFEHVTTKGIRPPAPSLKARAVNQTAVECAWTGPKNVVSQPGQPAQCLHRGGHDAVNYLWVWTTAHSASALLKAAPLASRGVQEDSPTWVRGPVQLLVEGSHLPPPFTWLSMTLTSVITLRVQGPSSCALAPLALRPHLWPLAGPTARHGGSGPLRH